MNLLRKVHGLLDDLEQDGPQENTDAGFEDAQVANLVKALLKHLCRLRKLFHNFVYHMFGTYLFVNCRKKIRKRFTLCFVS